MNKNISQKIQSLNLSLVHSHNINSIFLLTGLQVLKWCFWMYPPHHSLSFFLLSLCCCFCGHSCLWLNGFLFNNEKCHHFVCVRCCVQQKNVYFLRNDKVKVHFTQTTHLVAFSGAGTFGFDCLTVFWCNTTSFFTSTVSTVQQMTQTQKTAHVYLFVFKCFRWTCVCSVKGQRGKQVNPSQVILISIFSSFCILPFPRLLHLLLLLSIYNILLTLPPSPLPWLLYWFTRYPVVTFLWRRFPAGNRWHLPRSHLQCGSFKPSESPAHFDRKWCESLLRKLKDVQKFWTSDKPFVLFKCKPKVWAISADQGVFPNFPSFVFGILVASLLSYSSTGSCYHGDVSELRWALIEGIQCQT